jgi:hypothetical protein
MSELSEQRQPDAQVVSAPADHPSLSLYAILLLIAFALIGSAFAMQAKPDWPGLMLNLAAGLVGSVVVLIFVDQRLRAKELAALRRLPVRTRQILLALVFPTNRVSLRYVRRLLVALGPLVDLKIERSQFVELEANARTGFVLRAGPGEGKTTWTQMVARSLASRYLLCEDGGRIPILFPLARWMPERKLEDALYDNFVVYTRCWRWIFDRLLHTGLIVVLLDGYEELWRAELPLEEEVKRLRKVYPRVAWTLTATDEYPDPTDFGKVVTLSPPTAEERAAIRMRLRHDLDEAIIC